MNKKILLIEDHPETIEIYKDLLQKEGFSLEVLNSGKAAKNKIKAILEKKEEKPSLVLLDLMLPDINGDKLLKLMRNNSKTNNIPVIIFTNYTDPEQKRKLQELGIEKFITKTDQTPLEFLKVIKDWFEKNKN